MQLAQIDFGRLYQELGQKGSRGDKFVFDTSLTIGAIISTFIQYIFPLAGLALLVYLLYGGFLLMLSRGDPKAVQAAKAKLTNALAGFLIIFASYWIVQIVARVLGLPIVSIFGLLP